MAEILCRFIIDAKRNHFFTEMKKNLKMAKVTQITRNKYENSGLMLKIFLNKTGNWPHNEGLANEKNNLLNF